MRENELINLILQGNEEAALELIKKHEKNIYFCVKHTIENCGYICTYSDEFDELMQIGRMELYNAIFKFKDTGENTFQTFALKCIEQRIKQEIRHLRSNANQLYNNALRLDERVKEEEGILYGDTVKNNHPEYEPEYIMDLRNPKMIEHLLSDCFSADEYVVIMLRIEGYTYGEIAKMVGLGLKQVEYRIKKFEKFLNGRLT